MTDDQPTPAEALAAIRDSRRTVQRRIAAGSWRYDLSYSAILAMMVGSQTLDMPMNTLGVAIGVLLLAVLFRREADRLGVSITGLSPRRARWVAIGLGLAVLPLMLAAIAAGRLIDDGAALALVALGLMIATFGLALAASRLWLRVYRRETGVDE